jgi:hypothetical protein
MMLQRQNFLDCSIKAFIDTVTPQLQLGSGVLYILDSDVAFVLMTLGFSRKHIHAFITLKLNAISDAIPNDFQKSFQVTRFNSLLPFEIFKTPAA